MEVTSDFSERCLLARTVSYGSEGWGSLEVPGMGTVSELRGGWEV